MLHTNGWHTQISRLNNVCNYGPRFGIQVEATHRCCALFGESRFPGYNAPTLMGTWLSLTLYLGWWLFSTGPLVGLKVE